MSLNNIVGQPSVTKHLQNLLLLNRLPHAMLFHGPNGVGKKLTAVELAKTLNCISPIMSPKMDCCDNCITCNQISKNIYPDVTIITKLNDKEHLVIDQIRELEREAQFKPLSSTAYKIYIMDQAELLTDDAANSLLKTLEEPPPRVVLILLCHNKDVLPKTIISRCQHFRFKTLSPSELKNVCVSSNELKSANPDLYLPYSEGKPGQIVELINTDFLTNRDKILSFLNGIKNISTYKLSSFVTQESKKREGYRQFLKHLLLIVKYDNVYNKTLTLEIERQILLAQKMINANVVEQSAINSLFLTIKSLV